MKSLRKLPILIFVCILASSLVSCFASYQKSYARINEDVEKALAITLSKMPRDVVTTDTMQCFRNYITIAQVKDTASIAMLTEGGKTTLVAEANCDFLTVFRLSNQRASGSLLIISILWMIGSIWYMRKYKPDLLVQGLSYGGIVYVNDKFITKSGEQIRLTPMQHSLMEMFMNADGHTLSKQEICERLWPKKPDASDTLYTLIKRLKPIIESKSDLKIESDRGRSYILSTK